MRRWSMKRLRMDIRCWSSAWYRGYVLTGAKHAGPIHLLLTDVVMPQMSGPEVAENLRRSVRKSKCSYMSGYPDHPAFSKGGIDTGAFLSQKPFTPTTLAQKFVKCWMGRRSADPRFRGPLSVA